MEKIPQGRKEMKNKRQEIILKLLRENRMIKAKDLKQMFKVSMETIRRDLEFLEEEGYLSRVYGGAILKRFHGIEPEYGGRGIKNFEEKKKIALAATALVEDGDTIIIDVGTTTLEFAKHLYTFKNLTVLTNSIPIVVELKKSADIRTLIVGGEVRQGELSSSGCWAEEMISRFNVDKVFLGIGGIDGEKGVSDYHMEEANLRKYFIHSGQMLIGLADYSKFGVTALNKICEVSDFDYIVTDDRTPVKMVNQLKEKGVVPLIGRKVV